MDTATGCVAPLRYTGSNEKERGTDMRINDAEAHAMVLAHPTARIVTDGDNGWAEVATSERRAVVVTNEFGQVAVQVWFNGQSKTAHLTAGQATDLAAMLVMAAEHLERDAA